MRRLETIKAVLLVCIVGSGIGGTGCSSDTEKATEPEPAPVYSAYFWDGSVANWYYGYQPSANEVDSFYLPLQAQNEIAASADGQYLYISRTSSIAVAEIESRTIIELLPYDGSPIPSPDGQWLAIIGPQTRILKASDNSQVYFDDRPSFAGSFSVDGGKFHYIHGSGISDRYLSSVDIGDDFSVNDILLDIPSGVVLKSRISPDELSLYLYLQTNDCSAAFCVYDMIGDTVSFRHDFNPGNGDLAITPDGSRVFYSNPGEMVGLGECPIPAPEFYMYHILAGQSVTISTLNIFQDLDRPELWIGGLETTPDGKWLVAGEMAGSGVILAWDIEQSEFSHYVNLGGQYGRQILSLTCQSLR